MMDKIIIIFGFIFFMFGCKEPKFDSKDFIGAWKADDGACIVINDNGTFLFKDLNNSIINIAEIEKLNSKGVWKIVRGIHNGITGGISTGIEFNYFLSDGKGKVTFYINGQGVFGNKPPWYLFVWNGDPDEMIEYKFIKQTTQS